MPQFCDFDSRDTPSPSNDSGELQGRTRKDIKTYENLYVLMKPKGIKLAGKGY